MKSIKITVKDLVTFIHSGGDLTNEFKSNARAKKGQEIHSYHQGKYLDTDQKEVSVETLYQTDLFDFYITGRIDGLLSRDGKTIIEEIKSTTLDINLIKETSRPEHLAQAKMYAYLYVLKHNLKSIHVWLTYIKVDTYEEVTFKKRYNITQLKNFFEQTIMEYEVWQNILEEHQKSKHKSIEGLAFPFDTYREGQYTFMGAIYQALMTKEILYSIAPTGIGKTIASIFSSLKTIKDDREKVFYLTAKNAGKHIVVETVNLLKEKGLVCKSVVINSKESMCLMDKVDCDPDICPYAKGYFDREKEALNDIFVHQDVYDQELIKSYGEYHKICPHEFSLSISNYSDIIICDYNYAFDPRVHLIRYFDEDYYTPKLLIDEAHNMVDRSRAMYSSEISLETLEELRVATVSFKKQVRPYINKALKYMNDIIEAKELIKNPYYFQHELDIDLIKHLEKIVNKIEKILSENKKFITRETVLNRYFELVQFIRISELFNDHYRFVIEKTDTNTLFTLNCLNASGFIEEIIKVKDTGAIFFSATLNPIDYYVNLITNGIGKTIQIPSPFKQKNLGLYIDGRTSTRYRDRKRSIPYIIDSIYAMLESKQGNYIVFFPSYQYLNQVLKQFDGEGYDVFIQERSMSGYQRNDILTEFQKVGDRSKIGFFVLGGSFSEGVDYIGDKLHGVLVVGVALPAFNKSNELLRSYFDERFLNGFDYAYTYPGINKVIQAVGRVIRTETDRGIAILFDDRYTHNTYQFLMPDNWSHRKFIEQNTYLYSYLKPFWDNKT
jgi:DNA excision repair protein ERCC-2